MNIVLVAPRVAQSFINRFPEVRHNAYRYFNYDNRVVDERVNRGDMPSTYRGPDEFSDIDYDSLVKFAKAIVDPALLKYSVRVACEDALSKAIRSFGNGMFDGKVNAGRYNVLLSSMTEIRTAAKREKKREQKRERKAPTEVKFHTLKQLGLERKGLPYEHQIPKSKRKGPRIVRERGHVVVKREKAN